MAPFQFVVPLASQLTLDGVGYAFSTPGYQQPTLQGFKRDALPAGLPGNSFFDITIAVHASVHQDGDVVHPPVDFTFLDGGYTIDSSGVVTTTGLLPPPVDFNMGTTPGSVDLSFLNVSSPIIQLRPGVPFQLTTNFSLQMGNGPNSTYLSFPGLGAAIGGGGSFTSTFELRDPSFTLFAVDASNIHWNNNTGGSWADPTNWSPVPNGVNTTADFSTRDITTDATVTLDGNFTVGNLRFGDKVPSNNWTLSPGLAGGTLTMKVTSGSPTIDVANPTATPIPSANSAPLIPQSATISAVLVGSGGLNKTGAGTLVLTGQNTYTGTTSVKSGTLTLDFSAVGAPSSNILSGNSALSLGGGLTGATSGTLNIIGSGSGSTFQSFTGTAIDFGNNAINVNANGGGTVVALLGAVTRTNFGALNVTPPGPVPTGGTIVYSTDNNAAIQNTNGIIGGWATVGTGVTAGWAANDGFGNIVAFNGYIPIMGTPFINSTPTGNFQWTNNSSTNAAPASILAGVTTDINSLIYAESASAVTPSAFLNIPANSTLRLGSGGIFKNDDTSVNPTTVSMLTITGGATSILTAGGPNPNAPGELVLNANSATPDLNGIVVAAVVADNGTGSVTLVKTGNASVQMNAANTYTGGSYINSGRLRANASGGFGTGPVYVASGAQAYLNPNAIFSSNFFIAGKGFYEGGSGGIGAFSGGALRLAANGTTVSGNITLLSDSRITARGANGTGATISGKITGPFALDFSGAANAASTIGTLTLSNTANDWSGDTTIFNGQIIVGGSGEVIPNGPGKGNVIINGDSTFSGTNSVLNLNGKTETINGLFSAGDPSKVFIQGGGTLIVGDNSASGTFGGTIAGSLGLTKIGAGTQTLSGSNTYTGATMVAAGTLALAHANGLSAASPLTLLAGSTFATGGLNQTLGTLAVAGQSTIDFGAGSSLLHFNDVPTWTGTLRISNWTGNLNGPQVGGGPDQLLIGNGNPVTLGPIQFDGFDPGAAVLPTGEVVPLGLPYMYADFNRDTLITAADIPVMLSALTDPNAFMLAQNLEPDELLTIGDINHDGHFDNRDLQPLLDLAAAGAGAVSAVPEPASLSLAAFGIVGLILVKLRRKV